MKKEIKISAGQLNKTNGPFIRMMVFLVLLILLVNNVLSVFLTRLGG